MREEPIYTEGDMAVARNAFIRMKEQRDNLHQILWCAVKSIGGQVVIPNNVYCETKDFKLEKEDNPINCTMTLRCL